MAATPNLPDDVLRSNPAVEISGPDDLRESVSGPDDEAAAEARFGSPPIGRKLCAIKPPNADEPKESNEADQPPEETDVLEDNFRYDTDKYQRVLEKAIRSVAYLLEWQSDVSDGDIPGFVALGLAKPLRDCAKQSRYLFSLDDFRHAGKATGFDSKDVEVLIRALRPRD